MYVLQSILSILDTLGLKKMSCMIIEVSLFDRFIYTATTDCPYYRGVIIIEVSLTPNFRVPSLSTITGLTVHVYGCCHCCGLVSKIYYCKNNNTVHVHVHSKIRLI